MTPGKSTSERGYGNVHQELRKVWKARVDAGGVLCARCGRLTLPGQLWDLAMTTMTGRSTRAGASEV
jgi:hypothetical protein